MKQQRKKLKVCSHGPRNSRSHQNLHGARNDSPLESQERASQHLISDSGLYNCERINFCYLEPPRMWLFVMAALGNEYTLSPLTDNQ